MAWTVRLGGFQNSGAAHVQGYGELLLCTYEDSGIASFSATFNTRAGSFLEVLAVPRQLQWMELESAAPPHPEMYW